MPWGKTEIFGILLVPHANFWGYILLFSMLSAPQAKNFGVYLGYIEKIFAGGAAVIERFPANVTFNFPCP